jgi:hypothetical protein
MNLKYQDSKPWAIGGKIFVDDQAIGFIEKPPAEKWIAVAYNKPEGSDRLFSIKADAIFAVIEQAVTEAELEKHFAEIDKFVGQFHTAEEQQQLAQIDVAIEAAKYGEYA